MTSAPEAAAMRPPKAIASSERSEPSTPIRIVSRSWPDRMAGAAALHRGELAAQSAGFPQPVTAIHPDVRGPVRP